MQDDFQSPADSGPGNSGEERFLRLTHLADKGVTGLDPFPHVLLPHRLKDAEIRPGGEVLLESTGENDDANAGVIQLKKAPS